MERNVAPAAALELALTSLVERMKREIAEHGMITDDSARELRSLRDGAEKYFATREVLSVVQ